MYMYVELCIFPYTYTYICIMCVCVSMRAHNWSQICSNKCSPQTPILHTLQGLLV